MFEFKKVLKERIKKAKFFSKYPLVSSVLNSDSLIDKFKKRDAAIANQFICCPSAPLRSAFSLRYLRGVGIEIGALAGATPVVKECTVKYLDVCTLEEIREHFPHLKDYTLVKPDIIDDGETLSKIEWESLDFIIANHFFEHCEDPIRTLCTFFSKLKKEGYILMAIPDKRFTFDLPRPITTLDHLIADFKNGPELSRNQHYEEFVRMSDFATDNCEDAIQAEIDRLKKFKQRIHFHVWTPKEIFELLNYVKDKLLPELELVASGQSFGELLVVIRKGPIVPTEIN